MWNSKERNDFEVCFSEYVVETEWQASNQVSTERFQCKLGMIDLRERKRTVGVALQYFACVKGVEKAGRGGNKKKERVLRRKLVAY